MPEYLHDVHCLERRTDLSAHGHRRNPRYSRTACSRRPYTSPSCFYSYDRRVVYSVNPNVGWNGGKDTRQAAAKEEPLLRLVYNRG